MITNTSSQNSQLSVDSSISFSIDSSFISTQSMTLSGIKDKNQFNQDVNIKKDDEIRGDQISKQLSRFEQQKRQSNLFDRFQQHQQMIFVGFVGLGKANKNKTIQISQSKIKMAQKFMKLDQSPYFKSQKKQQDIDSSLSTQSIQDINKLEHEESIKIEQYPQFSLGFKSVGSGTLVKVSQQATNRAKLFLSDISEQKQTKTKFNRNQNDSKRESFTTFTNLTKTQKSKVVPKPSIKPVKIKKQEVDKKMLQDTILKINSKYKNIKLKDLIQFPISKQRQLSEEWSKYSCQTFIHNDMCKVKWCYYCQKYKNKQIYITKQFIKEQVKRILNPQTSTYNRFNQLIQLIIFKLYRYQSIDPTIKNKELNPNNLTLQLYKKCLFYQKERKGTLQLSLSNIIASRGKNLGKHINLIIVNIAHTQEMDMYFLQLSDGWTSVFAVITSTNQLYQYVANKRILIGSKMQIVNWNLYPIYNIGEYHPNKQIASSGSPFIQINYNNSLPSHYFSKLGWPKQCFYRSVYRSKQNGGNIPIVQGIIIRMFTMRNNKNILTNYIEILLREGSCLLMKISLSEQISLVQLFRLYYCYHFVRVKKISNSLLQFLVNSKYYQVNDEDRMNKVLQILKKRLVNQKISDLIVKQPRENNKKNYIDIVTKSVEFKIGDKKVSIQQKIQGTVLLQQYSIIYHSEGLVISKGDRGSCLRRIPKIYQKIEYNIL